MFEALVFVLDARVGESGLVTKAVAHEPRNGFSFTTEDFEGDAVKDFCWAGVKQTNDILCCSSVAVGELGCNVPRCSDQHVLDAMQVLVNLNFRLPNARTVFGREHSSFGAGRRRYLQ